MEEPFNGAISLALDPDDFVCLILENIIPAAAGCHGERLTVHSGLDQGSTLPDRPQQTHQDEESEMSGFLAEGFNFEFLQ